MLGTAPGSGATGVTLPPEPLAEYERVPVPTATADQLQAVVERHGLELDGPITPISTAGVVHALWRLGSQWVLRVPKNEEMCLGDHRCEAIAIPLARSAGVRTPALIAFDDSAEIFEVPYSIVEHVDGTNLVGLRPADPRYDATYRQLGEQLALLHGASVPDAPHPWLRVPDDRPAEDLFDEVREAGLLHDDGISWIRGLCEQLDARIMGEAPARRVFLHDDVKPDNLMVDLRGDVHLIDWGDAGYGDAAYDFQSVPLRAVRAALVSYRTLAPGDPALEARIVRRILARALVGLRRTPRLGPSWYRPIAATLTDVLAFVGDFPVDWSEWTNGR